MSHLKYRPDIDGLRAVAVLGVVIFHAFPTWIPGGYTGVDIFFVISGYLISGILFKGHQEGNFSFKEFYARRVRRLFPSLITLLLISLVLGWFALLPIEYQSLGKHMAAGTLFIQNFVFWKESGYFDVEAIRKPMLHLWSLAVEEQFYIFFPPLLLLIWKRKWPLVIILGVFLLVSLIGNLVMSVQNVTTDFFLTSYRAWEFLGGSLLAWWHFDRGHEEDIPLYREGLSILGVALLGIGMFSLCKGAPYPGWRALFPVVGTLLIMEGGRGAWFNKNVLSNQAVVWIGLISYPLYLFHWPALSLVHIVEGLHPATALLWSALGVSFFLASGTYYFIERPIRFSKLSWILPLLITSFLTVGITSFLVWKGVIKNSTGQAAAKVTEALDDKNINRKFDILQGTHFVRVRTMGGKGLRTLFLGDSNMQQYAPRIAELLKDNENNDRGAYFVTAGGTMPVDGVTSKNPALQGYKELMPSFWKTLNSDPRIDRVVIAAYWYGYFRQGSGYSFRGVSLDDDSAKTLCLAELDSLLQMLHERKIKVYFVLGVPSGDELDPSNELKRSLTLITIKKIPEFPVADFLVKAGWTRDRMAQIAKKNDVILIDPLPSLCTNGICIYQNEEGPIRYNDCHLRPAYVKDHIKYLDATVASYHNSK